MRRPQFTSGTDRAKPAIRGAGHAAPGCALESKTMRWLGGLLALVSALGASCSDQAAAPRAVPTAVPGASAPAARPAVTPTPALPAYYIESLRARPYPGGKLEIRDVMMRGQGFTKHHMSWPSNGQTMTGTISLPDGPGPFPVVVVNHGFIPPERYWIGQDSGIFGDPMAARGFIAVAPNWPGYAGSGPAPADLPPIVGQVVIALDLISSLSTLPQADLGRVACVGHSNGAGMCQIMMVVDPRLKAVVLHGPVSSDMAENGRKWWLNRPETIQMLGSPESNAEGYRHLSPRNYFEAGQPPVLIIHGTRDHSCPPEWSVATQEALTKKGVRMELRWFEGADHDFVGADLAGAVAAQEAWIREALRV